MDSICSQKLKQKAWVNFGQHPLILYLLEARNNLRAMKKGDLAFFYHSNCKELGIVGIMEIVQEHSPDCTLFLIFHENMRLHTWLSYLTNPQHLTVSAHNPKAPYYDSSSKESDPKWSVVHVAFHSKFKEIIPLRELRKEGVPGGALEKMQLLKQSRLSVSRVSVQEWEYLLGVAHAEVSA